MNGTLIPHTPIAVDFWKVRKCPTAKLFFLTHMHTDHTVGLTSSWSRPLYCSPVTGILLKRKFKIKEHFIQTLEVGEAHTVFLDDSHCEQMAVTPLDANHCPGSVMYLFEGYFGTILYTGDFRYCQSMFKDGPLHTGLNVDTLYLDNTYCDPRIEIPTRQQALDHIFDIVDSHPQHRVLIAMRQLGKEQLLLKLAYHCQLNISVESWRYSLYEDLQLPTVFSQDETMGRIATVDFHKFNLKLLERLNMARPTIAILPTALYSVLDQKSYTKHPNVYIVPYSDHSSFTELKQFVSHVGPGRVIPIVKQGRNQGDSWNNHNMSYFDRLLDSQNSNKPITIPESVRAFMENRNVCDKRYSASTKRMARVHERKPLFAGKKSKSDSVKGVRYGSSVNSARKQSAQEEVQSYPFGRGSPSTVSFKKKKRVSTMDKSHTPHQDSSHHHSKGKNGNDDLMQTTQPSFAAKFNAMKKKINDGLPLSTSIQQALPRVSDQKSGSGDSQSDSVQVKSASALHDKKNKGNAKSTSLKIPYSIIKSKLHDNNVAQSKLPSLGYSFKSHDNCKKPKNNAHSKIHQHDPSLVSGLGDQNIEHRLLQTNSPQQVSPPRSKSWTADALSTLIQSEPSQYPPIRENNAGQRLLKVRSICEPSPQRKCGKRVVSEENRFNNLQSGNSTTIISLTDTGESRCNLSNSNTGMQGFSTIETPTPELLSKDPIQGSGWFLLEPAIKTEPISCSSDAEICDFSEPRTTANLSHEAFCLSKVKVEPVQNIQHQMHSESHSAGTWQSPQPFQSLNVVNFRSPGGTLSGFDRALAHTDTCCSTDAVVREKTGADHIRSASSNNIDKAQDFLPRILNVSSLCSPPSENIPQLHLTEIKTPRKRGRPRKERVILNKKKQELILTERPVQIIEKLQKVVIAKNPEEASNSSKRERPRNVNPGYDLSSRKLSISKEMDEIQKLKIVEGLAPKESENTSTWKILYDSNSVNNVLPRGRGRARGRKRGCSSMLSQDLSCPWKRTRVSPKYSHDIKYPNKHGSIKYIADVRAKCGISKPLVTTDSTTDGNLTTLNISHANIKASNMGAEVKIIRKRGRPRKIKNPPASFDHGPSRRRTVDVAKKSTKFVAELNTCDDTEVYDSTDVDYVSGNGKKETEVQYSLNEKFTRKTLENNDLSIQSEPERHNLSQAEQSISRVENGMLEICGEARVFNKPVIALSEINTCQTEDISKLKCDNLVNKPKRGRPRKIRNPPASFGNGPSRLHNVAVAVAEKFVAELMTRDDTEVYDGTDVDYVSGNGKTETELHCEKFTSNDHSTQSESEGRNLSQAKPSISRVENGTLKVCGEARLFGKPVIALSEMNTGQTEDISKVKCDNFVDKPQRGRPRKMRKPPVSFDNGPSRLHTVAVAEKSTKFVAELNTCDNIEVYDGTDVDYVAGNGKTATELQCEKFTSETLENNDHSTQSESEGLNSSQAEPSISRVEIGTVEVCGESRLFEKPVIPLSEINTCSQTEDTMTVKCDKLVEKPAGSSTDPCETNKSKDATTTSPNDLAENVSIKQIKSIGSKSKQCDKESLSVQSESEGHNLSQVEQSISRVENGTLEVCGEARLFGKPVIALSEMNTGQTEDISKVKCDNFVDKPQRGRPRKMRKPPVSFDNGPSRLHTVAVAEKSTKFVAELNTCDNIEVYDGTDVDYVAGNGKTATELQCEKFTSETLENNDHSTQSESEGLNSSQAEPSISRVEIGTVEVCGESRLFEKPVIPLSEINTCCQTEDTMTVKCDKLVEKPAGFSTDPCETNKSKDATTTSPNDLAENVSIKQIKSIGSRSKQCDKESLSVQSESEGHNLSQVEQSISRVVNGTLEVCGEARLFGKPVIAPSEMNTCQTEDISKVKCDNLVDKPQRGRPRKMSKPPASFDHGPSRLHTVAVAEKSTKFVAELITRDDTEVYDGTDVDYVAGNGKTETELQCEKFTNKTLDNIDNSMQSEAEGCNLSQSDITSISRVENGTVEVCGESRLFEKPVIPLSEINTCCQTEDMMTVKCDKLVEKPVSSSTDPCETNKSKDATTTSPNDLAENVSVKQIKSIGSRSKHCDGETQTSGRMQENKYCQTEQIQVLSTLNDSVKERETQTISESWSGTFLQEKHCQTAQNEEKAIILTHVVSTKKKENNVVANQSTASVNAQKGERDDVCRMNKDNRFTLSATDGSQTDQIMRIPISHNPVGHSKDDPVLGIDQENGAEVNVTVSPNSQEQVAFTKHSQLGLRDFIVESQICKSIGKDSDTETEFSDDMSLHGFVMGASQKSRNTRLKDFRKDYQKNTNCQMIEEVASPASSPSVLLKQDTQNIDHRRDNCRTVEVYGNLELQDENQNLTAGNNQFAPMWHVTEDENLTKQVDSLTNSGKSCNTSHRIICDDQDYQDLNDNEPSNSTNGLDHELCGTSSTSKVSHNDLINVIDSNGDRARATNEPDILNDILCRTDLKNQSIPDDACTQIGDPAMKLLDANDDVQSLNIDTTDALEDRGNISSDDIKINQLGVEVAVDKIRTKHDTDTGDDTEASVNKQVVWFGDSSLSDIFTGSFRSPRRNLICVHDEIVPGSHSNLRDSSAVLHTYDTDHAEIDAEIEAVSKLCTPGNEQDKLVSEESIHVERQLQSMETKPEQTLENFSVAETLDQKGSSSGQNELVNDNCPTEDIELCIHSQDKVQNGQGNVSESSEIKYSISKKRKIEDISHGKNLSSPGSCMVYLSEPLSPSISGVRIKRLQRPLFTEGHQRSKNTGDLSDVWPVHDNDVNLTISDKKVTKALNKRTDIHNYAANRSKQISPEIKTILPVQKFKEGEDVSSAAELRKPSMECGNVKIFNNDSSNVREDSPEINAVSGEDVYKLTSPTFYGGNNSKHLSPEIKSPAKNTRNDSSDSADYCVNTQNIDRGHKSKTVETVYNVEPEPLPSVEDAGLSVSFGIPTRTINDPVTPTYRKRKVDGSQKDDSSFHSFSLASLCVRSSHCPTIASSVAYSRSKIMADGLSYRNNELTKQKNTSSRRLGDTYGHITSHFEPTEISAIEAKEAQQGPLTSTMCHKLPDDSMQRDTLLFNHATCGLCQSFKELTDKGLVLPSTSPGMELLILEESLKLHAKSKLPTRNSRQDFSTVRSSLNVIPTKQWKGYEKPKFNVKKRN